MDESAKWTCLKSYSFFSKLHSSIESLLDGVKSVWFEC